MTFRHVLPNMQEKAVGAIDDIFEESSWLPFGTRQHHIEWPLMPQFSRLASARRATRSRERLSTTTPPRFIADSSPRALLESP